MLCFNSGRRSKVLAASLLSGLALAAASAAHADPAKDIQVAGRALGFLENAPSGHAVIGIVYDPGKPGSVSQKDALMAALGGGLAAGSATLVGKPIAIGDVDGASGLAALYATDGVSYGAVGAAGKAKKIVTMSADKACAESGACVMSVATTPAVEITVNRNAASAVGAVFKAAFRMMIHEI